MEVPVNLKIQKVQEKCKSLQDPDERNPTTLSISILEKIQFIENTHKFRRTKALKVTKTASPKCVRGITKSTVCLVPVAIQKLSREKRRLVEK